MSTNEADTIRKVERPTGFYMLVTGGATFILMNLSVVALCFLKIFCWSMGWPF